MTFKIFGIFLIILSALSYIIQFKKTNRMKEKLIESLINDFNYIYNNISLFKTPTDILFKNLSKKSEKPLKIFYREFLNDNINMDLINVNFEPDTFDFLEIYLKEFGKSDYNIILKNTKETEERLKTILYEIKEKRKNNERVSCLLLSGITLLIVIILL